MTPEKQFEIFRKLCLDTIWQLLELTVTLSAEKPRDWTKRKICPQCPSHFSSPRSSRSSDLCLFRGFFGNSLVASIRKAWLIFIKSKPAKVNCIELTVANIQRQLPSRLPQYLEHQSSRLFHDYSCPKLAIFMTFRGICCRALVGV